MKQTLIPLDAIQASPTARDINEANVAALAASIQATGLLQPVLVQAAKVMRGGVFAQGYRMVAGHHRAAAVRRLGRADINAIVLDESLGYLETELIEIDENLIRAELTPAQRAIAIKRRKEIWDVLHLNSSGTNCSTGIGYGNPPLRKQQFAAETAAVSGQSKQDINRHIARADALGTDLHAVAGTSLDKGVELDALKAMPAEQRTPLIARAQAGEKVSARAPAARISLTIEYFDVHDGASSIARSIILRDRRLALALLDELNLQLLEAA